MLTERYMTMINELKIPGYKRVIEAKEEKTGLHCFIAIHDTTLGPSLGGVRMYPYQKPEDALYDVLRLAKAMTYKSAIAQDGLGGGKSVIIANPATDKTDELLSAFAEVVDHLKGDYIAAEDVGTNIEDLMAIRKKTPYVAAIPTEKGSGDPSPFTAWGVLRGMQAVAMKLWGSPSLLNKKVLIQGLGNVGSKLANILFWEGADLIYSEVSKERLDAHIKKYGGTAASQNIFDTPCDIFSPCAMGAIINKKTVHQLDCQAIAGSANNQLESPELGEILYQKKILYAPDFIINAGGIINAAAEFNVEGYNPRWVRDRVSQIYDHLLNIFQQSESKGLSTEVIAEEVAEYNVKHKIGARLEPIIF